MKSINPLAVLLIVLVSSTPSWSACTNPSGSNVQLQVLGSGGPRDSAGRASSSYLLWIDGVARIMIDSGSGTKVPFHQSGATFDEIDLVALSHLHPDHSAELPAVLWPAGGSFKIAGPSEGESFPSLETFIDRNFGENGTFPILSGRIDLDPLTIDVSSHETTEVWRDGDILVRGRSVPHGDVPAIGYRVDVGDFSIAFSSDQNGSDPAWAEFAKDIDLLVVHFGTTEERETPLHAKPSVWGQMASDANAGHVIVSHIATSSDDVLATSVAHLKNNYAGQVTVAEDLMCVEVI